MIFVTVLTVELMIFESATLKQKRSLVRSVLRRARNQFPVAAAEVDLQDDPTRAVIACAALSSDAQVSHASVQRVLAWIESSRLDCQVGAVSTETIEI